MEYAHWKLNIGLIRALIDKSTDTIRWLEQKDLIFDQLIPHDANPDTNTYHSISGQMSTGALIIKALLNDCQRLGVQILVLTRAKKLHMASKGKLGMLQLQQKMVIFELTQKVSFSRREVFKVTRN